GPRHRGALARAGDAEQGLEPLPRREPLAQPGDGRRLVAGGLEVGDESEVRHGGDATAGSPGTIRAGGTAVGTMTRMRAAAWRPVLLWALAGTAIAVALALGDLARTHDTLGG